MSFINTVKGWFNTLLHGKIQDEFDVKPLSSPQMESLVKTCGRVYAGTPDWVDEDDGIKTVNFAQSICSETARLTTLGIKIKLDGSARAEWLQEQIDANFYRLREWVEYGCAAGTLVLKPNGKGIDVVTPDNFRVISQEDGKITAIVFEDTSVNDKGDKFYKRLEYHRYDENGLYHITNKCFVGKSESDAGKPIAIEETPWKMLEEDTTIENVDGNLYGVFKTPQANNVDIGSALGLPLFAPALAELEDLDVAYSRNAAEIEDSQKIVLLDSDRLIPTGGQVSQTSSAFEIERKEMKLPRYIRNVYGDGRENFYQEINPELRTAERLAGINALLSQIGYKCGFSNGYFVFNQKTGMVTATQVEAEDRRTIQLVKDMRDKLEDCLNGLIKALNTFADLYDLAPLGDYEAVYDFGDITYNVEEDRGRWWSYVIAGKVPAWKYFVKFEGMSEDEAKEMITEATPTPSALFGVEE